MGKRESFPAEVTNDAPIVDGKPSSRGELIVRCGQLFGDEVSDPIAPGFQYAGGGFGMFFVPPIGATVDLELDQDLDNPDFRWRTCLYNFNNPLPEEFGIKSFLYRDEVGESPVNRGANRYPKRMGIKLPAGLMMVDITEGDEHIWFHHITGAGFEINKNGDILFFAEQDFGIEVARNGLIKLTGNLVIDFANLKLGGDSVTEPMPLGNLLLAAINGFINGSHNVHIHDDPLSGVTGPPKIPAIPIPSTVLSQVIKGR
jgi:hypothetical protein